MARKWHNAEGILRLLREIEVHLHGGMEVDSACRTAGISDKTYYANSIKLKGTPDGKNSLIYRK